MALAKSVLFCKRSSHWSVDWEADLAGHFILAFEGVEVRLRDAKYWISDRALSLTFAEDAPPDCEADLSAAAATTSVLSSLPAYMMATNRSWSAECIENAR